MAPLQQIYFVSSTEDYCFFRVKIHLMAESALNWWIRICYMDTGYKLWYDNRSFVSHGKSFDWSWHENPIFYMCRFVE